MKQTQCIFICSFVGIFLVLIVLYLFYRCTFNGSLSTEISDWIAFVDIFNGVGILLLTALNVWIFYKLTLLIAENEEKHRLYDKQKAALNNFISSMYVVFQPDTEYPICEINRDLLGKVYRKFELMKEVYAPICKEFGNDEFAKFVEEFRGFCLDYFQEESAESQGKDMKEEAYKIFIKALAIETRISKEINKSH
jgi:hypothetical protein